MRLNLVVAMVLVAVGCDNEAGFIDARIPDAAPVPGTFSLAWTMTDTADAMPVTCDDANATSMIVTVREEGAGNGLTELFNCTSGSAMSRPLVPGTYVLGFELRGPGGLIASAPGQTGIVVTSTQDTPIGTVDFALDANGAFTLQLITVGTTTNCDLIANMGGGVTATELSLDKLSTCATAGYTVGSTPGTVTCPPSSAACIERTETITFDTLPAGRYALGVNGYIGADACWVGASEIRVPIGGATTAYTLTLGYPEVLPGCPTLP